MSKRIGEFLVERGLLTPDQLTEALRSQLILGGHLGTCLIELGLMAEKDLGQALSDLHGVPYADPEALRRVPQKIIGALPGKLAERYSVVPIGQEPRTLRVAMANPANLQALDEIKFATGQKIETWVAPEVRIVEALERYYGIQRRPRFVSICRELDRRGAESVSGRKAPEPQPVLAAIAEGTSSSPAPVVLGPEPAGSEDPAPDESSFGYGRSWKEIADEETFSDLPDRGVHEPAPTIGDAEEDLLASTMTLDETAFLLCGADEIKHVGSTVMSWVAGVAARGILFAVKEGKATIWEAHGFAPSGKGWAGLNWPVSSGWVFELLGGVEVFRGPVPDSPAMRGFYGLLGIDPPTEAVVLPVHLNDRLVAVLYLDGGTSARVKESTENVTRAGRMLALALNLLILKKKLMSV